MTEREADKGALERRVIMLEAGQQQLQDSLTKLLNMLHGDGRLGLVGKVAVIWNTYIWLLCTLSAAAGWCAHYLADK